MSKSAIRKPIGHFFIKKSLQLRLIYKIVAAVMISTAVCIVTVQLTYSLKYRDAGFYRVDLATMDISERFEIANIILPGLLISGAVNLLVGLAIGLYASRKYAVPVYKLEQWASLLKDGKMTAKLRFREKEELRDLSGHCNKLSENMREKFLRIKRQADVLKERHKESPEVKVIDDVLAGLELEANPIEVHTQFHRVPLQRPGEGAGPA